MDDFIITDISKATVHTNCHFSYRGNYYLAPYTLIGEEVSVIVMDNILKAFHKGEEIALHPLRKNAKGEHITNKDHYPPNKNITGEDTKSSYREKMSQIGKNALGSLTCICNKTARVNIIVGVLPGFCPFARNMMIELLTMHA